MNEPTQSTSLRTALEALCPRFERAWQTGHEPDLLRFLAQEARGLAAADLKALLCELVAIDLHHRWRRAATRGGRSAAGAGAVTLPIDAVPTLPAQPLLEDYLRLLPELGSLEQLPTDLFVDEYQVRLRCGGHPTHEEYRRRCGPRWREVSVALRELDARPPTRRPAVALDVRSGPQQGHRFIFERAASFLIGRAAEAQLRLADDACVSSYHCRLELNPPDCYLTDLGSRNGTFVNGETVRERFLVQGDIVRVGGTELALSVVEAGFERQLTPGETQTLAIPPLFSPTTSSAGLENVPGFDLVREIGRGGMGVVYEAVQQSNGQRVALKVIVPARTADERAIQFFLREASVLSQLNHKRIVQFHGLQMSAGRLILAMEYVPSVAHRDYLAAKKEAVRVRCYCGIICQVLDALRYAHARGIVHRDIKPSNILLTPDGRGLGAKVADFGLAKNFQDAGFSHLTGRGEQRGTVPFMPPEQVQDPCYAKPAADIYAAGATLYSYLAGRSPYVCSRSEDPWVVILELEPTPLQSLRPDLPPELTGLVHKALARRPEDRFASAREMYRALHPFAKGRAR